MAKKIYTEEELKALKQRHMRLRYAMVALTVAAIVILAIIKSNLHRQELEQKQRRQQIEDSIGRVNQANFERRRAAERAEYQRFADSIAALPRVEPPKPEEPKYSWSRLETMVQDLSNDGYYASIWKVDDGTSTWIVMYEKRGKQYIRTVNPETDKYGPATRIKKYEAGKYYVYGDKSRWYIMGHFGELIYEVNGVERARYTDHNTINLFTPDFDPDDYDDYDDW